MSESRGRQMSQSETSALTDAEQIAVQEVLERVRQIVGNNNPDWTGRYGHDHLARAFTADARAAADKLPDGPYARSLRGWS